MQKTWSRGTLAIWACGLLLGIASCKNEADVTFTVKVVNNKGELLQNARVAINNQSIGQTNDHGSLVRRVKLQVGTIARLEVSKDDANYYFAPYVKSYDVKTPDSSDVSVNAVLYSVPKPSLDPKSKDSEDDIPTVAATTPSPAPESSPAAVVTTPPTPTPESAQEASIAAVSPQEEIKQPEELAQVDVADDVVDDVAIEPKTPDAPTTSASREELFTVHVYSKQVPVRGAKIFLGVNDTATLSPACETNDRGRCVIKQRTLPHGLVTLLVRKAGYRSALRPIKCENGGESRFELSPGYSLDVFVKERAYNISQGLPGIDVYVGKEKIGVTDQFGFLSHPFRGKKDDLIQVSLQSENFLPEKYATEFVVSGDLTLEKYFTPKEPPVAKIGLLPTRSAGTADDMRHLGPVATLNLKIARALRANFFEKGVFLEFTEANLAAALQSAGLSTANVTTKGWAGTDLTTKIDAVIQPTFLKEDGADLLELSLIDINGVVLAAARAPIKDLQSQSGFDAVVQECGTRIKRLFAFEGAVLKRDRQTVTVNLGFMTGRMAQAHDALEVYGVQTAKDGHSEEFRKIALLTVQKVEPKELVATIRNVLPRALVSRGDLVVLKPANTNAFSSESHQNSPSVLFKLIDSARKDAFVKNASVYLGGTWLGSTNEAGVIRLGRSTLKNDGKLRFYKSGYGAAEYDLKGLAADNNQLDVPIKREAAFLVIDSQPRGAQVFVEGSKIGVTPLQAPIAIPTGFITLELKGVAGFKEFKRVMELEEGTISLVGKHRVDLEVDLYSQARRSLEVGRVDKAIAQLKDIPKSHSDYVLAQHRLGELFLTEKADPVAASHHFEEVLADGEVKSFHDKRFITAYVNEGRALYEIGDLHYAQDPQVALAHYKKSIETLDMAVPYTRFIKKEDSQNAVTALEYYKILAKQKIWQISKDPQLLGDVLSEWKAFLSTKAQAKIDNDLIQNANVYMKQAQASLGTSNPPL